MKTTFLNIALLIGSFSISSPAFATGAIEPTTTVISNTIQYKKLAPLKTHQLEFDVYNLCISVIINN